MKKSSCWYSSYTSFVFVCALILSLLSGVCFFPPDAHAAISFAQQNANTFGSVSTASVSFAAATTAGDLVIVGIYFGPSSSVLSVTDSQANVYTQIGTALSSPTAQQTSALIYATNINGGVGTVTVRLNVTP